MSRIADLLSTRKWVYWLDLSKPGPTPGTFLVSIVIENESGHYPTGTEEKSPWYWDEDTCAKKNFRERGFRPERVAKIIASSMAFRKNRPIPNL